MKPIQHPWCNKTLTRPEGMSEKQCADLPVYFDEGSVEAPPTVSSFWQPDQEQIKELAKGGTIMLTIVGCTHPPLALNVLKA